MAPDPVAFICDWTRLEAPPLVPEIKLHLAGPVTPLWEATERTLEQTGLPPPYWAFAWPGGQAIARHLLDHPALVAGKSVLDFAAGSGIGAIAAARAGASSVMATDLDDFALAAIKLNAAANAVMVETSAVDATSGESRCQVILAGDVCYERPMAERVWPWLVSEANAGVLVLLADPGRAYLPKQGLQELTRYRVPTSRELEDREERETIVYRVVP